MQSTYSTCISWAGTINVDTYDKMLQICTSVPPVETIVLSGCETWTLSNELTNWKDGWHVRTLRIVRKNVIKAELYGDLTKLVTHNCAPVR